MTDPIPARSRRPKTLRTLATIGVGCAAILALAGCTGGGAAESTAPGSNAGSGSGSGSGSSVTDTLASEGGACTSGDNVTISAPESSVVLTGDCGEVKVTGDRSNVNLEKAKSVVVSGTGSTVLGETWGSVVVDGIDNTVNLRKIDSLEVPGSGAKIILSGALGEAKVLGDQAILNGTDARQLTLQGSNATVILTGTLESLRVTGDGNSVTWSKGADAPKSDTGSGNSYKR